MPVLQRDDGTWIELINQREIVLHQELDDATALYRSMSDADLRLMRAAFVSDLNEAFADDRSITVDFCNGRLALIDAELERRKGD